MDTFCKNFQLIVRFIIFLLLIVSIGGRIHAQEPYQKIEFDTVHLKQGYVLTINKHSYISKKDTILLISSNVPYTIERKRGENFYERLDSSAQYSRLVRELRNIVIKQKRPNISIDKESTIKSEVNFVPYKDKIIRKITFKQLDVFGPTIEDTAKVAVYWLEKTGNNLHMKTKPYLLRNNLIIKEGDLLDPLKLADNERLLREASYLHDAKIYVQELNPESDSVDIYIVVKDVWSVAFDVKINNLSGGEFSIWDRNIFGFGNESQNTIYWNSKENSSVGFESVYIIPNIAGTFVEGKAQYLDKFDNTTYGISLERNFYTPNTKYAGGLSYFKTNKPDYFAYSDTTIRASVNYDKSDFWLGRSFALNSHNFKSRNNLSLAVRVTNTHINKRPFLTEDEFYNYHNRTLYLSSITFTKQNYYKSNLIYNFGRTEDIPYGLQFELKGGFETNEFKSRCFIGSKIGLASYKEGLGYFYFSTGYEGFTNVDKKIEQGLLYAKFKHFTPLLKYKKFKLRHFVDIEYTKGINRYDDEYLTLNDEYGLDGLVNDSLKGNERLNLHLETVWFSPWYFYDFRFLFFASAECSLFGKDKCIWNNPLYSGFSFGIRIRNERLVFNTLEIRFHIYPNKPQYSQTNNISISGEKVLSPENFKAHAPEISAFR